jgi:alkanesulfonate monooxygenase SsuD/methylene tetrahydromethanopterin reductase-like flavin-dependent oxidoreductase (luciferase family)
MPIFTVDRYLPGLTPEQLGALQKALTEAARRVSVEEQPVRYLRTIYVPARGHCVCVFAAGSAEAVARAAELAQLPFAAIDEALAARGAGCP